MDAMTVARYVVFGCVALAALAALGSWLVRTRRVSPFSGLGRGLRALTDPIVAPVERRVVRMGGNPVHAGGWLVVAAAIVGIILLSVFGWMQTSFRTAQFAAVAGPRATAALVINIVYRVLVLALLVRMIGSWFGLFRYSRWTRPAYVLTDWIVAPLRRVVPPLGAFDVTLLVAWLALYILRRILLAALML